MASASVELLRIPLRDIVAPCRDDLSRIKVFSLSERYTALSDPINTIPVLVDAQPDGKYKLIDGHEIYEALKQSQERLWIWAMRLTPAAQRDDCWAYEMGLRETRINISDISEDELNDILEYLSQNIPKLSKMCAGAIVERIGKDPMRCHWSSLDPLRVPNSGLTKASLEELSRYLEAIPQPPSALVPICINTASGDEIAKTLQRLCLEEEGARLRKLDLNAIGEAITAHPERAYWEEGKDLCRAIAGLTSSLQGLLSQGFLFTPQTPPVPNTVRFLLTKLTVKALREEASARGLPSKGLTKSQLVNALAEDP